MRVQIINLASAISRMAFQRTQMEALELSWERLEALTPEALPVPPDDQRWKQWERPMRKREIALLLSHCSAWKRIIAAGEPQLIIEDDALLAAKVPGFLRSLVGKQGMDHVTLEVRGRRKLVGRMHPTLPVRRLYQDRTGAAAYVLWPSGAEKLLARAENSPALADATICSAYELSSWQADPGLCLQLDQCVAYGIIPPITTSSSMATEPRPRGTLAHRLRRVMAQFRIGVRQISKAGMARRRFIPVSSDWPSLVLTQKKTSLRH